ncbi:MAG TPA: PKD domain-containing protein, partial [Catalimonadaceae bacterium]|nr:PKD domain-containing protein [Catalimonadaceae bacterium]
MKNRILFFLAILLPVLPKCAIAQIDFSTVLTQPECANTNTGKIEVIPSGSAGPFTITLIKGNSNQGPAERLVTSPGAYTFTGLGAGGYSVLVSGSEPSCSQVRKKVQINNPPDFFGSVYQIDSSCAPCDVNLIADFQPPGNFSYAWNTNQTTSKITGVCDGSYTVTVTKLSTGCQKQFSISAANETPSLFINLPGSICPDQSNTFTFEVPSTSSGPCVVVNPDSVVWDFGDNTGSFDVSPNHTYSASGTYTIVLTINGGLSATETITVN